jgi:transcriptional regulator with XRE-family HTH domain/Zn-dependent peptidase ImmA (M78 family)
MIRNERQYRITKSQAKKFADALRDVRARSGVDPRLRQLEDDAIASQLQELRQQIQEYEVLRSGQSSVLTLESFDCFPRALVQARIASGLSQKELAGRLGLKEQQVQRYEATDYASASLSRVREVIDALGIQVREDIFLPVQEATPKTLFDRLRTIGVEKSFVLDRLLPPTLAACLTKGTKSPGRSILLQAASIVGRVFNWTADELLGSGPLQLKTEAAGLARFKLPARADEHRLTAYTVYSHFLAELAVAATEGLSPLPIPNDATECRDAILSRYGAVTFQNVLDFAWGLGVVVLPLSASGMFHGAFWRIGGRNVVVLKQETCSLARWLNDLLHELSHAGQEPAEPERSVLEESEMSPQRRESEEEQQASLFAGNVMLDCRAESLAQKCVQTAGGKVERLKSTVQTVAAAEGVEVDALANYMAWRLSLQGINWWGAATNLQKRETSPWGITCDYLLSRLNLKLLEVTDQNLLVQALSSREE